jgi:hypothetical protein
MLIKERGFAATPVAIDLTGQEGPLTIAVAPGQGSTVRVEVSYDNARTYADWSEGNVTAATNATTAEGQTPTHVRCSVVAGTAESFVVVSK